MDPSTHEEDTVISTRLPPGPLDETWVSLPLPPPRRWSTTTVAAAKSHVAFRTSRGRVIVVPAPVAIVGLTALFAAMLLAAFDPQPIRSSALDQQARSLLSWETAERARVDASLAKLEPEIRELRRVALSAGIVPPATFDCQAAGTDHLARHLQEAAWLSGELVSRTRESAELDLLPSRSPIDLTAGWVVSSGPITPGVHVSSTMGSRSDPFTGQRKAHQGLDVAAPAGTAVVAPSTGTVEFAGAVDPSDDHSRALLGKHILLRHGDSGYSTLYAHLDKVDVKAGQKVKTGERIGSVGSTGRSTAPHLHYQVMRGEGKSRENVDPLYFITDSILVRDGRDVWFTPLPKAATATATASAPVAGGSP